MAFILHANRTLFVTAINNDTGEGKVPDVTQYYPFAFSSATAVEPGSRVPDAAVCSFDKRQFPIADQTGKTAAQIRTALSLVV